MEHGDLRQYFRALSPKEYLTEETLERWSFGPPEKPTEPDPRVGIGDYVRTLVFSPREGLPTHETDHYSLLNVYEGAFTFRFSDHERTISEGNLILLSPGFQIHVQPCSEADLGIVIAMDETLLKRFLPLWDMRAFAKLSASGGQSPGIPARSALYAVPCGQMAQYPLVFQRVVL